MTNSESQNVAALTDMYVELWRRRWLIVGVSTAVALIAAFGSLFLPNVYRADVLLTPAVSDDDNGGSLANFGNIGGLAALAGFPGSASGSIDEYLAVLRSRQFIWQFVEDENLMPILFADQWDVAALDWREADQENRPTLWDAYRLILEDPILQVARDSKTGLVTVSMLWTDAELAANWANSLVTRLNEYLRSDAIERSKSNLEYLNEELARSSIAEMRQTLFQLIAKEQRTAMLANTQSEFAFRVLDPAVATDKKYSPKRAVITVVFGMIGLLLSLVFILAWQLKLAIQRDA